jgi:predicted nuclease with TOPRIM domain
MSELSGLLSTVQEKTKKVLLRTAELQQELKEKGTELQMLKEQLHQCKAENNTLEIQLKTRETAHAIQGEGSSKTAAKLKINELVREIDRCISLLNK